MSSFRKDFKGSRILITGGLGFLGSNIAHEAVRLGARVELLDNLSPLYGANRFNISGIEDQVTVFQGDIRDEALMAELVKGKDFIFNFAAQVSYLDSVRDPLLDLDVNCRGHLITLEACRKHNPRVKILFSSSRLVYGKTVSNPVREMHPTEPLSIYGAHKLAAEKYYQNYYKAYGIKSAILRITNPYGPRQQMRHSKYSILGWFIRQAMEEKTIQVFGDGSQIRDYIYAEDIVQGFIAAALSEVTDGRCFNIGLGEGVPFRDMVDTILRTVGRGKLEYIPWPPSYEQNETGDFVADISLLRNAARWTPRVTLDEGVERTFHFYKTHQRFYW